MKIPHQNAGMHQKNNAEQRNFQAIRDKEATLLNVASAFSESRLEVHGLIAAVANFLED
jgi:hypothetical protein